MMKNDFSFSDDSAKNETAQPDSASGVSILHEDHKPLHHLPRGKAWNPPILKKWWFWPASVGALIALNLAVTLWSRLFGQ
jgi:hypothetical protein